MPAPRASRVPAELSLDGGLGAVPARPLLQGHPGAGSVPHHPHLPHVELCLLPKLSPQLGVKVLSFAADISPDLPRGTGAAPCLPDPLPARLKPRAHGPVAMSVASLQGLAPCFSLSTPQTESSASYSVMFECMHL